jgi:hypothetical protein
MDGDAVAEPIWDAMVKAYDAQAPRAPTRCRS